MTLFTVILITCMILGGIISLFSHRKGFNVFFKDEIIKYPFLFSYTADNASYLYLVLAVRLSKVARSDLKQKLSSAKQYIRNKFGINNEDYNENYLIALKCEVSLENLAKYFRTKLTDKSQRIGLIHYLCGIALVDGFIESSERKFIDHFCKLLELDPRVVTNILDQYYSNKQEKENQKKQSAIPNFTSKDKYAQILELKHNAQWPEIKKSYRKLAKKWHPDFFAQKDNSAKLLAHEKFKEIKEAYDYFEKTVSKT